MNEQEQRVWSSKLTLRAEDGEMPTLEGLAVAYDEEFPVRDYYGTYTEVWRAGSTRNAAQDDVVLLVDHDGLPLARTTSGTLNLREDSKGLHVSAQLDSNDPDVARLLPKLERGDMTRMSVAFQALEEDWSENRDKREIKGVELFDVSVVTRPANPATTVALRTRVEHFESAEGDEPEEQSFNDDDLWMELIATEEYGVQSFSL